MNTASLNSAGAKTTMDTMQKNTIMIMAGGTGGHVFPALAVAKRLHKQGVESHWMGTCKGIEARVVPENDIALHTIDIAGLRGKSLVKALIGPFNVAKAILQARRILKKVKPQVVLGMGGYASGPGGIAARLLGIPLIVHEQNATPGSTNKILAKVSQRVLCGFPNAIKKGHFVGNPVRDAFYQQLPPRTRYEQRGSLKGRALNILVLGGSLGAKALNLNVPKALALLPADQAVHVMHQSGERTAQESKEAYHQLKQVRPDISATLMTFIDDVALEMANADLIICRSGALTVAELAAVGVPSILIPFPYAIDDHQTANGKWLVDKGAAALCQESTMTPESLAKTICSLVKDEEQLISMAEKALERNDATATELVSAVCMEYINV